MRYIIDAWLEDSAPRLDVRDADTGAVRLRWRYANHDTAARDYDARRALQDLFKKLVLLSCANKINLVERAKSSTIGTECLECGECVSGVDVVAVVDNVVYLRDHYAPDQTK